MSVTIRQVAQHAGVSPMTVSNVLRERTGTFRSETRDKVLAAARELGYRASALPTAMRTGTFNLVALVAATITTRTWAPTPPLDGINDALHQAGKHLLYCKIDEEHFLSEEKDGTTPRLFRETQADGLLINGMHPDRHRRLADAVGTYPTVFLNSALERDAIHPDDHLAGVEAAALMRDHRRRKLGYLSFHTGGHYSMDHRRDGFLAGASGRSVTVIEPRSAPSCSFPRQDWHDLADRMLDAGCDGIFVYCTHEAEVVAERAALRGLGPDELTISSVSEGLVRYGPWRLPTFRIPLYQLGSQGAAMLLRKIAKPKRREPAIALPMALEDD